MESAEESKEPVSLHLRTGFPVDKRIAALCERILSCFEGTGGTLILMGSLADGTWTGYSDVDLLYIGPDFEFTQELRTIRRATLCASRLALEFDHLQHHGPFVMPRTAAAGFSVLPPSALQDALILKGEGPVEIGGWQTGPEVVMPFINKCLRVGGKPGARPKNLYQLKLLLSQIALMPTLFYRAQGIDISKPQAIKRFIREFPDASQALITASEIRRWWQRPDSRWFRFGLRACPDPWRFAAISARAFGINHFLKEELNHEFYKHVQRFGEVMLNALDR